MAVGSDWGEEPCGVILTDLALARLNPLLGAVAGMCYVPTLCPPPPNYPPPSPPVWGPSGTPCPQPLAWIPTIQCKDAKWSTNTVCRDRCAPLVPTCRIVVELRNGVPCRCDCRPGECRGKLGTFNIERGFRP